MLEQNCWSEVDETVFMGLLRLVDMDLMTVEYFMDCTNYSSF